MRNSGKETGLGSVGSLRNQFGLAELGMDLLPFAHIFFSCGHSLEHKVDGDGAEHHHGQHEQRPGDHVSQDMQLDVGRVPALQLDVLRPIHEFHTHCVGRLGFRLVPVEPDFAQTRIRGTIVIRIQLHCRIHFSDSANLNVIVIEPDSHPNGQLSNLQDYEFTLASNNI